MASQKQNSHRKIDPKKAKLTSKKFLEANSLTKAKLTSARKMRLTFKIRKTHTRFSRKLIATLFQAGNGLC